MSIVNDNMSDTPETDAAEAKRRAEWLHKHKAHKDWIILSISEVAVIRDELLAVERKRDEALELVKSYQEYSKLLGDEINDTAAVAYVHGWRSNRYEQGKVLREKIKQLEETK